MWSAFGGGSGETGYADPDVSIFDLKRDLERMRKDNKQRAASDSATIFDFQKDILRLRSEVAQLRVDQSKASTNGTRTNPTTPLIGAPVSRTTISEDVVSDPLPNSQSSSSNQPAHSSQEGNSSEQSTPEVPESPTKQSCNSISVQESYVTHEQLAASLKEEGKVRSAAVSVIQNMVGDDLHRSQVEIENTLLGVESLKAQVESLQSETALIAEVLQRQHNNAGLDQAGQEGIAPQLQNLPEDVKAVLMQEIEMRSNLQDEMKAMTEVLTSKIAESDQKVVALHEEFNNVVSTNVEGTKSILDSEISLRRSADTDTNKRFDAIEQSVVSLQKNLREEIKQTAKKDEETRDAMLTEVSIRQTVAFELEQALGKLKNEHANLIAEEAQRSQEALKTEVQIRKSIGDAFFDRMDVLEAEFKNLKANTDTAVELMQEGGSAAKRPKDQPSSFDILAARVDCLEQNFQTKVIQATAGHKKDLEASLEANKKLQEQVDTLQEQIAVLNSVKTQADQTLVAQKATAEAVENINDKLEFHFDRVLQSETMVGKTKDTIHISLANLKDELEKKISKASELISATNETHTFHKTSYDSTLATLQEEVNRQVSMLSEKCTFFEDKQVVTEALVKTLNEEVERITTADAALASRCQKLSDSIQVCTDKIDRTDNKILGAKERVDGRIGKLEEKIDG